MTVKHYRLYYDKRLDKVYLIGRQHLDQFMKIEDIECLNCGRSYVILFSHDSGESVVEDAKRKDRHHLVRGYCRFCGAVIAEKEYINPNFIETNKAGT